MQMGRLLQSNFCTVIEAERWGVLKRSGLIDCRSALGSNREHAFISERTLLMRGV